MLAVGCMLATPAVVSGFGAEGHRIAGQVAQTRLCDRAVRRIEALSAGQSLAELGSWADRIRSEDRWAHTAPWHYMNVADELPMARYQSPPEGDVLWAITHFGTQLASDSLASARRLEALRFLAHFVVDIHQPLHVGRALDRGGNRVWVTTADGTAMNLHRFWDSETIRLADRPESDYAEDVLAIVEASAHEWEGLTALDWAEESRKLRWRVYDFGEDGLTAAYLAEAVSVTRLRLAQASVRLASEINRRLCD